MYYEEDQEWMNASLGTPVEVKRQLKKTYSVVDMYVIAACAFGMGCCIVSVIWLLM